MWTRKELKTRAKAAFKANYWRSVLVALILTAITVSGTAMLSSAGTSGGTLGGLYGSGAVTVQPGNNGTNNNDSNDFDYEAVAKDPNASVADLLKLAGVPDNQITEMLNGVDRDELPVVIGLVFLTLLGVITVICIISFIVRLLLLNPLMIGCRSFFMLNSRTHNASVAAVEKGFTPRYGRNIGTILLMDIYQALWTMLFIIPGIIKAYSYRMVPYILADDPEIGANEAITRSRQIMKGNKWRTFVLDLSFILWDFLSLITLGLVGLFYVNPYIYSTDAELYNALKTSAPVAETAPADEAE